MKPLLILSKLSLFFSVCIFYKTVNSNNITLSENSTISLLTCSSGNELYSAFGHSAIRVYDSNTGMDIIFSYGAFDFYQPDFYLNFLKGKLDFMLIIESTPDFIDSYKNEDRTIDELILNIGQHERQKIFDYLMWNAQPENRMYAYDFYYNNCATKIRDVFENNTDNVVLSYNPDLFENKTSMRKMLDKYLADMTWIQLGFYFILGLPSDTLALPVHQIFLPDYLRISFLNGTNNREPLLSKSNTLLPSSDIKTTNLSLFHPNIILPLFFVLSFFIGLHYDKKGIKISLTVFFAMTGLLGLLLTAMWVATDHQVTHKNLNLLWAFPINIFILPLLWIKNNNLLWLIFIRVYGLWLLILCPVLFCLPQSIHVAIYVSLFISGNALLFYAVKFKQFT